MTRMCGGKLYFSGDDGRTGNELWMFDFSPVLTLNSSAAAYLENASPVVIAPTANFTPGLASPAGGSLAISWLAAGTTSDALAVENQGTGPGQIGFSGGLVSFSGTTIGSAAGGAGGATLMITLNPAATAPAVQALVRAIVYSNTSENPSTVARTLRFTLVDGAAASTMADITISVTSVNDAPTITINTAPFNYTQGSAAVVIDGGATVSDVDSSNFFGGNLTVSLASATIDDRLTIQNQGSGVGQIGLSGNTVTLGGIGIGTFSGGNPATTPLLVGLNANASVAAVAALARAIMYVNVNAAAPTGARVCEFTVNDGSGGTSPAVSRTINLVAAPTINVGGPLALAFVAALSAPSTEASYSVVGTMLAAGITVTSNAPEFEVSLTSGIAFASSIVLPATGGTVFVRYAPGSGISHSGTISHVCGSVTGANKVVTGVVFAITTAGPLVNATENTAYAPAPLASSGGLAPVTWSLEPGAPIWLTLSPVGQLGGIPPVGSAGVVAFDVRATDSSSPAVYVIKNFPLTIDPVPPPSTSGNGGSNGDSGGCSTTHSGTPALVVIFFVTALLAVGRNMRRTDRRQSSSSV